MTNTSPPPRVERLNGGQPILRRISDHPWENKVVFNPAVVLVEDRKLLNAAINALPVDATTKERLRHHGALCFLYYRAQGAETPLHDYRRSSLGLAVLTPDLQCIVRLDAPVITPEFAYEDLGVEDPRITRIADRFFMVYAAYASGKEKNRIRIAMATSEDLVHWEKHGPLRGTLNAIDNKNGMVFPSRIDGQYHLLHRPMEGDNALSIHRAVADDLFGEWRTTGVLMKPIPNSEFKDVWIGGGAPPLPLSGGRWLILYHVGNRRSDGQREYDLGIAVGDQTGSDFVVCRTEPLLRPTTDSETTGDAELGVNNVVFICGAYFYHGDVYFPYAGADSVVLAGKIPKKELETYLSAGGRRISAE